MVFEEGEGRNDGGWGDVDGELILPDGEPGDSLGGVGRRATAMQRAYCWMYLGRHDIRYWPYAWRLCALSSYLSVASSASAAMLLERNWLTCWVDDGHVELACSAALRVSLPYIISIV